MYAPCKYRDVILKDLQAYRIKAIKESKFNATKKSSSFFCKLKNVNIREIPVRKNQFAKNCNLGSYFSPQFSTPWHVHKNSLRESFLLRM